MWNSGSHDAAVDCGRAHRGGCSAAATIGSSGGVRLTYQGRDIANGQYDPANLPDDAYYSAWFFIPDVPSVSWLNVFQFKYRYQGGGSRPMHYVVLQDSGGEFLMELHSQMSATGGFGGGARIIDRSGVAVPIGEWFQIESRYVWSRTGNGRITTWLDGRLVWDVGGLYTEGNWDFGHWGREWAVNNYGSGIDPSPFTIWIDDAAVSGSRLGP